MNANTTAKLLVNAPESLIVIITLFPLTFCLLLIRLLHPVPSFTPNRSLVK